MSKMLIKCPLCGNPKGQKPDHHNLSIMARDKAAFLYGPCVPCLLKSFKSLDEIRSEIQLFFGLTIPMEGCWTDRHINNRPHGPEAAYQFLISDNGAQMVQIAECYARHYPKLITHKSSSSLGLNEVFKDWAYLVIGYRGEILTECGILGALIAGYRPTKQNRNCQFKLKNHISLEVDL